MKSFRDIVQESKSDTITELIKFGDLEFGGLRNNGNTYGPEIYFYIDGNKISITFNKGEVYFAPGNGDYRRISREMGNVIRGASKLSNKEGLALLKKHFKKEYDKITEKFITVTGRPLDLELLDIVSKLHPKYFGKTAKALRKMNSLVDMIVYLLENEDFKVDGLYLTSKDLELRIGKSYGEQSVKLTDNNYGIINTIGSVLDWYEIQGAKTVEKITSKQLEEITEKLSDELKDKYAKFLGYTPSPDRATTTGPGTGYQRKSGPDYSGHKFGGSIGGDSSNYR
jgi:hypothetical protein